MKFFDMALDLENRIIEVYRELARRCVAHEGIRNILLMLIQDQERHVRRLTALQGRESSILEDSPVFREARKLFESMQSRRETFSCDLDQVKMYRQALDLLEKKQRLYLDAAETSTSAANRDFLVKISGEEEKQALVLQNIIAMVERPDQWIEDAEFNHLDEY